MSTGGISSSRRRNAGAAAAGSDRSAALQQLKNLRQQGGRRVDAFEIKLDDKIYDSVAEDDYAKLVAKRRAAVKDFVVDDGGLGYNDDGEEDDWEAGDLPYSSSEEAEADGGSARRKKAAKDSSENRKKKDGGNPSKKASALSAAAAMMGKQNVSSMFASASMFRKNKEDKSGQIKGFSTDSILEDVLAEITPDEVDREKRRRRAGTKSAAALGNAFVHSIQRSPQAFCSSLPEYEVSEVSREPCINLESRQELPTIETAHEYAPSETKKSQSSKSAIEDQCVSVQCSADITEDPSCKENSLKPKVMPSDNCEAISADGELKAKAEKDDKDKCVLNALIGCENSSGKATADWQAVWQGGDEKMAKIEETDDRSTSEDVNDLPLESDGALLFYLVDAYEEAYGDHPGTIYLFGKAW